MLLLLPLECVVQSGGVPRWIRVPGWTTDIHVMCTHCRPTFGQSCKPHAHTRSLPCVSMSQYTCRVHGIWLSLVLSSLDLATSLLDRQTSLDDRKLLHSIPSHQLHTQLLYMYIHCFCLQCVVDYHYLVWCHWCGGSSWHGPLLLWHAQHNKVSTISRIAISVPK